MELLVSADIALRSGDKLGRFQLLVPIGSGGMGRVWVAREDNTRRLFAIKTTLTDEQAGGEFWNVLLDEARIAAQVHHRSVCAIHAFEVDEQRGVPYLVMDFSDGGSLHELLEACPEHRIEPVLAANIITRLCEGLQVAHDLTDEHGTSLGVVHRDVSPQNILISANGDVQLTDFGVAKARGRLHAATETGEIKGKLSYMAPEQVTTRTVDRRADVFALGCVLYEATVGERPFHGDDAVSTLYQLLERPLVLPSERMAGYPSSLEEIVVKALARDLTERYQSAEELGRALSVWIAGQGRLVTEQDIAALVQASIGAQLKARALRITAAENAIDAPPAPDERLGDASASTSAVTQTAQIRRAKTKWAASTVGGLSLLALALAGLGVSRLRSTNTPLPVVSSVATKVEPEPPRSSAGGARAAEESVTVTLRAEPAAAVLFLDDGAALPNPYKLSATRDENAHRVRAAAAGFSERVEVVRFDRNKEVVISLSQASSGNQPNSHTPVPKVGVVPAHSAPITLRPGELPTVVKKPPRALDPDNPFSNP